MRGANRPPARRRRTPTVGGLLIGGLLVTGTAAAGLAAFTGGDATPVRSRLPQVRVLGVSQTSDCAALTAELDAGRAVDTAKAIACDQRESAEMDALRSRALSRGERPAVGSSPTCSAVDRRAAAGDPNLDFDLAFHCRQRERFAARDNEQDGMAADGATSLCRGVRVRRERGEPVDAFPQAFCAQEAGVADAPSGRPSGASATPWWRNYPDRDPSSVDTPGGARR